MRVACSTKLFAETSLSIEYHKGIQNQPQPQSYLYEYVCRLRAASHDGRVRASAAPNRTRPGVVTLAVGRTSRAGKRAELLRNDTGWPYAP
jgi:hypothetical protein